MGKICSSGGEEDQLCINGTLCVNTISNNKKCIVLIENCYLYYSYIAECYTCMEGYELNNDICALIEVDDED